MDGGRDARQPWACPRRTLPRGPAALLRESARGLDARADRHQRVEPAEHLVSHRARDVPFGAPASGGLRGMTAPAVARRGELLPGFMLPTIDGSSVSMESYRGRTNLVVVFAGDMIDESPNDRSDQLSMRAVRLV